MKCQLWFNWRGCASRWEAFFFTRNVYFFSLDGVLFLVFYLGIFYLIFFWMMWVYLEVGDIRLRANCPHCHCPTSPGVLCQRVFWRTLIGHLVAIGCCTICNLQNITMCCIVNLTSQIKLDPKTSTCDCIHYAQCPPKPKMIL